MALDFFKRRVIQLSDEIVNTRIFLNMVIHDMRNPINNISFALDASLSNMERVNDFISQFERDLNTEMVFNRSKSRQKS